MNHWLSISLALLVAGMVGCQPGASPDDIAEIKQQLTQIAADVKEIKEQPRGQAAARRQRPTEDYSKVYEIEVGASPVKGDADAPVALVEYSDFQCPFCSRAQGNIKALLEKYPDKVKLVYKHFPLQFHREARPAALASMAAQEQGKFWEMHDVLFENQKSLSEDKLEEYATQAGLDIERFKQDLEEKAEEFDARVRADLEQGRQVDVRGTPSLYIGGRKVRNWTSIEAMSTMVEEAAKRAESAS